MNVASTKSFSSSRSNSSANSENGNVKNSKSPQASYLFNKRKVGIFLAKRISKTISFTPHNWIVVAIFTLATQMTSLVDTRLISFEELSQQSSYEVNVNLFADDSFANPLPQTHTFSTQDMIFIEVSIAIMCSANNAGYAAMEINGIIKRSQILFVGGLRA